jgi:hypothetical protein
VIPTEGGDASTVLQKRFLSVLKDLEGRTVGADALFDVLKLEVLDWRLDHGVDTEALAPMPDAADSIAAIRTSAPPEEAPS